MTTMFTLEGTETFRQEIRKSRFIAAAGPVSSEAAAKEFIAAHSDPAANHNCWAWKIGQAYRFSDDGEPKGTAGKPTLQAIEGQSLDGWFGGILLGGGGLIRAYGGTAATCLRAAAKVPIIRTREATIACGFGDLALLQTRLAAHPAAQVLTQAYTATGGELVAAIHEDRVEEIRQMVADLTSGRATMSRAV